MTVVALAVSASAACSGKGAQSGAAPTGPHAFEGVLDYRGLLGRPPGKPFTMHCSVRGEDLSCDVTTQSVGTVGVGFRGPGSTLCFRLPVSPVWIPISIQTLAMFEAMLPDDIRKDMVSHVQGQYQFPGRTDVVMGRACEYVENHESDGCVETDCYSRELFFAGDQKLVPALRQIGYDPGFVSAISKYGMGLRVYEKDATGAPKLSLEATHIEERPVDPHVFAGVCGMP